MRVGHLNTLLYRQHQSALSNSTYLGVQGMTLRQHYRHALVFSALTIGLLGCEQAPVEVKATGDISRPAMIVTLQPQGISQTQFTGVVRSAERAEIGRAHV